MTTYYVGSGGNNGNAGMSWGARKLTLNGAEDIPVVAGDIVYVGPGTYREVLTVDVSGSSGNVIQYIGDYLGTNTDGVGGIVRVTGSDNDQTMVRANGITAITKSFRSFTGFVFDMSTGPLMNLVLGCTDIRVSKCYFQHHQTSIPSIDITGAGQARVIIENCWLCPIGGIQPNLRITHTANVDDCAHEVNNCVVMSSVGTNGAAIASIRVGGIAVKNCTFFGTTRAISVSTAITVGQTVTVNNCIIYGCTTGLQATVTGEILEDYNTFSCTITARTNVAVGTNSVTYPPLFDSRWFFQLLYLGAGPSSSTQVISPFDLASFSQLINLAGTSPTTTDMRGTSAISSVREWGALEYDSTLNTQAGGGSGGAGGGAVFGASGGVIK